MRSLEEELKKEKAKAKAAEEELEKEKAKAQAAAAAAEEELEKAKAKAKAAAQEALPAIDNGIRIDMKITVCSLHFLSLTLLGRPFESHSRESAEQGSQRDRFVGVDMQIHRQGVLRQTIEK